MWSFWEKGGSKTNGVADVEKRFSRSAFWIRMRHKKAIASSSTMVGTPKENAARETRAIARASLKDKSKRKSKAVEKVANAKAGKNKNKPVTSQKKPQKKLVSIVESTIAELPNVLNPYEEEMLLKFFELFGVVATTKTTISIVTKKGIRANVSKVPSNRLIRLVASLVVHFS